MTDPKEIEKGYSVIMEYGEQASVIQTQIDEKEIRWMELAEKDV